MLNAVEGGSPISLHTSVKFFFNSSSMLIVMGIRSLIPHGFYVFPMYHIRTINCNKVLVRTRIRNERSHRESGGFFAIWQNVERAAQALADVIRDRDLTGEVLAFNASWALERSGAASEDVPDDVMRTVVTHMGGFYELLYFCLKEGLPFDVRTELPPVVKAFEDALAGTRHLSIA